MRKSALARLILRVTLIVALLISSVWVWNHLPYPTDVEAPFFSHGSMGERVDTPTVTVQISGVKVGTQLKNRTSVTKTDGRWVMVEGTVTSTRSPGEASANLIIGGRTYTQDARAPWGTFTNPFTPLSAGIPQTGVWIFEVPNDVVETSGASAEIHIWIGGGSVVPRFFPRLPAISIPLDEKRAPRVQTLIPPVTRMGMQ